MPMDPVVMFERAATRASSLAGQVRPEQWGAPTPCAEWDVETLLDHMGGGTSYLLEALGLDPIPGAGKDGKAYRDAVTHCVDALQQPGVLDGRCMSPVGFEWSVREAAAGTAMDQLVHTWDLAVAIGADRQLDPELVDACAEMFLPQMPELGRAAGLIGPAAAVSVDASAQDRFLGALGRHL